MKRVELFVVEETFLFERDTWSKLILHPDLSVPKTECWQELTEMVSVLVPDGRILEATAVFSLAHFNIRDPDVSMDQRWRVVVHLIGKSKEEVPIGSKVLVSQAVRDALLS